MHEIKSTSNNFTNSDMAKACLFFVIACFAIHGTLFDLVAAVAPFFAPMPYLKVLAIVSIGFLTFIGFFDFMRFALWLLIAGIEKLGEGPAYHADLNPDKGARP